MKPKQILQLKPDERVVAVLREAVVPYVFWMVFFFVWIVAPFFFLFPLFRQGPFGVILFFALTLSGLLVGFRRLFVWRHSIVLITDRRVVDVEQHGFFDRTFSEADYADVEDITFRVRGIIPTIFRYGTLRVKTAGNAADMEMRRVHRPSVYHDLLHDLRQEAAVSVPKNLRSRKVKELAEHLSDEEVNQLTSRVRARERDQAMRTFYEDDTKAGN
jgi:hypothetical protein